MLIEGPFLTKYINSHAHHYTISRNMHSNCGSCDHPTKSDAWSFLGKSQNMPTTLSNDRIVTWVTQTSSKLIKPSSLVNFRINSSVSAWKPFFPCVKFPIKEVKVQSSLHWALLHFFSTYNLLSIVVSCYPLGLGCSKKQISPRCLSFRRAQISNFRFSSWKLTVCRHFLSSPNILAPEVSPLFAD